MKASKPLVVRLSLCVAAALLTAACARSIDMSVASVHQKTPEFDFLLYQDGWACLSQGSGRNACGGATGGRLRDLFAQRSATRSLRDYLTENGASCRAANTGVTCSYLKTVEAPSLAGRQVSASRDEAFEMNVSFPVKDVGLAPEQITTALRRVSRVL